MKCPYVVNRHVEQQIVTEYDENGVPTFQQTVESNTAESVDCLETQCGAYKDSRCAYRGID